MKTAHPIPTTATARSWPDDSPAGPPRAHARAAAPALAGLSIVLPCHDEAPSLPGMIADAAIVGASSCGDFEIIVVDDGSSDDSGRVAARCAAGDPRVRLVVHAHRRGYGAALRSGIAAARMDWVLLVDADGQYDLRELADFASLASEADVVWGRRILRCDGVRRRVGAALWNRLVHALYAVPVRDVDCGFKLIRRELAQQLPLRAAGTLISTELAICCHRSGARIAEAGVHHRPRTAGVQSGSLLRALSELAARHGALRRVPRVSG